MLWPWLNCMKMTGVDSREGNVIPLPWEYEYPETQRARISGAPPPHSQPPPIPTVCLQYCFTLLHWAAHNGDEAVCRVLIEAGANVDAVDMVRYS